MKWAVQHSVMKTCTQHKTKVHAHRSHRTKPDKGSRSVSKGQTQSRLVEASETPHHVNEYIWRGIRGNSMQLQRMTKRWENRKWCDSFSLLNNCSLLGFEDSAALIPWQLTTRGGRVITFLISKLDAWSFVPQLLLYSEAEWGHCAGTFI